MARKRYRPEELVGKLRHEQILHGQGMSRAAAKRQVGISEARSTAGAQEYGGTAGNQLHRPKQLEKENERLRSAVPP